MRRRVLRSIVSSLLSLVVAATFLWGGCVSCEQYFMFPGKHQSCCNKSGQCERPGKNSSKPEKLDCNRLALQRTATVHIPMPAALPAPMAPAAAQLPATILHGWWYEVSTDPSPPDAQALHVTFLI